MAKTKPKPREINLIVDINRGDSIDFDFSKLSENKFNLRVHRQNKTISPRKINYVTLYSRPNGKPKLLSKLEFVEPKKFTFSHEEFIKKFDHIWAIDTNKKLILGNLINVAVATEGDTSGTGEYLPTIGIIFGATKGNSELYAWRKFIELISLEVMNCSTKSLMLIVDSDYDKIGRINDREIPIHGEFYLPKEWVLSFATSDSGKESIINKMIALSDKTSTKILNRISEKEIEIIVDHCQPIADEDNHDPILVPIQLLDFNI